MKNRNAMKNACSIGLLLLFAGAGAPTADAQVLYGSIVGNVTDSSQAVIAAATVTIANAETNLTRKTVTSDTGAYNFTNTPSGTYSLTVTKEGFTTFTQSHVVVTINTISRVDAHLNVGAVSESVTVSAGTATLQTDRAEVRQEIVSQQLVNLPVPLGRNYQQLFRVLPGFAPPVNAHSVPTNPSRALAFNVNGASRSSNNTRIDGASSTVIQLPHVVAYVPSLESIETVNIVTNSFDAEQGLAGGAAVSLQTKSGTNQLHGALFEYHTNQHLKAKPFFLPAGQGKPKLVNNQFGGAIGGPIKKDKLFFFVAYEGTFDRAAASRFGVVPTADIKAGIMSGSSRPVHDPATGDVLGNNRQPFPNNIVPLARQNPIARKLADLTPLPTLSGLSNNYFVAAPFLFDRHTVDTKVNWNISEKLNTFVRFSRLRYNSFNQEMFDQLGGPPINGGNAGNSDGGTYSATVAVNYVATPNFLIDAYYGYTRMDTNSAQRRLDEKLGLDFLGIPGTNGPRQFEGGWPTFAVNNYTNIGTADNYMPYYRSDPQYQYVANFNWTKGSHNVRFGVDIYRQHLNQTQAEFVGGAAHGAQGGFTFGGNPTLTRGGPSADQFNSYAAFLLGLPTVIGKILQVPDTYNLRATLHSYYIRDHWNITPRLTLDYGMRWEYFPMPTRSDRGLERYDPVANKVLICGVGQVPNDCGVKLSKRKFAPRLGLAYRANDSTVLRAGYGITNDPFIGTELLRANYPVLIPLVIDAPDGFQAAGRLSDGIPAIRVPDYGNGIVDIPGNYGFAGYPETFRRGYLQSWNFSIQRQVGFGFVGEAAYVATRETNKIGYLDINSGQVIGAGNAGRPLNRFGRNATTTILTPTGTGQYNSLQTKLERRFAQGVQLNIGYTWSKSIGPIDNSDSSPSIKALDYFSLNRVVRSFDRTHSFNVSAIWELPFGKGRKHLNSGAASWILGGWQVNNIISLMTGTPFTVSASGNSLNLPGSSQQADQVLAEVQKVGGTGRGQSFFDPLAFAPVTQARFGTSGINTLRGPGIVNWDLGIFREFAAGERWKLQFRMESFNFSNTPHFANPGGNASAITFNPDGSIRDRGGYTEITSVTNLAREGADERQFRFGLRVSF
ncbi:MAG: TonB-dependent receptor [Acidobacteriia bacterium]|nr:TonB-dependent receptor [Terriglobia bacterium]